MNYHLSAELLSQSTANDVLDSIYYPSRVNCDKIKSTSTYQKLKKLTGTSGDITFPHSGGNADLDCYYALHNVSYLFDRSHRTIDIHDRYDFDDKNEHDYSDVVGTVLNVMYKAQQAGVIVPYQVRISVSY